ncbi:hypothetical protein M1D89_07375 [Arthrobacter sp. D3-18]
MGAAGMLPGKEWTLLCGALGDYRGADVGLFWGEAYPWREVLQATDGRTRDLATLALEPAGVF